ncbi:MAG: hypothetical protein ACI4MJ_12600 [Aristaeellaceae bacterium]
MKRLIVCILAAMLLCQPMVALGDGTQSMTLTLQTDAARLSPLMTALTGKEQPALCEKLAALLNTCVLEGRWQEDATVTTFSLNGETLLTYTIRYMEDAASITSNLIPGYALHMAREAEINWAVLEQCDWSDEWSYFLTQAETLLASLEQTEERGSFLGDAYEGGVRRVTFQLDDQTVYLLAECMMNALAQSEDYARLMNHQAASGYDALAGIRTELLPGALENVYRYQLSLVYDAQDTLIGISLTAMEGEKQISTLSVAPVEGGISMVWGYGMGGVNYYWRLLAVTEETADGTQSLGMQLSIFQDVQHWGYAMVSQLDGAALEEHRLSLACTPSDTETGFSGQYIYVTPAENVTLSWQGTYNGETSAVNATADWYHAGDEDSLLTLHLTTRETEPFEVDMEGLTAVNLDTMDEATADTLMQVMNQYTMELSITLFKMLPAELLLLMQ